MSDTTKSFWQTAPGMITAVAALITALGGLLAVLLQNGVIGQAGDSQPASTAPAVAATTSGNDAQAGSSTETTETTNASSLISWTQATATLVRTDGTKSTVKATTVGLTCDTQSLVLESGQRIGLEQVGSIRFQAVYPESGSADAVVTMLNGRRLAESINTRNCPVSGTNELGPVQIEMADIARIDFRR